MRGRDSSSREAEISDLRATSAGSSGDHGPARRAGVVPRRGRPDEGGSADVLDDIRAAIDGDGRDVPPAEREPVAEVA